MTAPVRIATRAAACAIAVLAAGGVLSGTPAAAQEPAPAAGTLPDTATVGIATNSPPRAGDDSISTFRDVPVTVDLFANDRDPDGDPLSLVGATSAGHGVLSFAGSLATYTSDAGWSGLDAFTYLVDDGRGGQATGRVWITVVAPLVAGPHQRPPVGEAPPVVVVVDVPLAVPRPPELPVEVPVERPAAVAPAEPLGPPTRAAAPLRALPLSDTAVAAPLRAPRVVAAPAARPASLPFTGSSTGALTGLGVGLTAAGFLLGRPRRTT